MVHGNNEEPVLQILLVEDDKTACDEIENYIDLCDNVNLVAITNNASKALDLTAQHLPDAVILDLELHHGSGNGLMYLHELPKLNLIYRPYILVTTNNSSDITYETARQFGADFIMAKHESDYSGQYAVEFLRMIHATLLVNKKMLSANSTECESPEAKHRKLTTRIGRELDLVGINRKNIGYQYLCDAILLIVEQSDVNFSTVLAEKYHKAEDTIEHAMQYAINRAWRTFPIEELEAHYTAKTHSCRGVPTVYEFIFYYVDLLKTRY